MTTSLRPNLSLLLRRTCLATAAAIFGSMSHSHAIDFNDGGTHTINDASYVNEIISVSNSTTLNIEPGAVIEGRVDVFDTSNLNVSGGQFGPTGLSGWIRLLDDSTATISGGSFGGTGLTSGTGRVITLGHSVLTIEGGDFGANGTENGSGLIGPSSNSVVYIRGGNFGGSGSLTGSIQARGNATVYITGGTFGTGTSSSAGSWSATDSATLHVSGGTLLTRPGNSPHSSTTFSADARIVFEGCEFSSSGTPLPFGVLPNIGVLRIDGTFANGETFNVTGYSTTGGTYRLDFAPCDPVIFQTTYFTPPSTAALSFYSASIDQRAVQLAWFEVEEPTAIGSVGGRFRLAGEESRILFGAIAEVGGDGQFPSPLDLTGTDVLGTTLLRVDPTSDSNGVMMCADLPLDLQPGWYVVAFGAGQFGADDLSQSALLPFMPISSTGGPRTGTIVTRSDSDPNAFGQADGPIIFVSTATGCPNTVLNSSPVAEAGPEQTVECTGHLTTVSLDGTGSSDPDGDALSYEWSVPTGVTLDDVNSPTPTGEFPVGPTLVTLTVTDGNGGSDTDDVLIMVEDTTPPVVVCTTDLIALLPPNHSMRPVQICVAVTEQCSEFSLSCAVSSSEADDADGDGAFTGDVDGQDGFTSPVIVDLTFDPESGCYLGEVDLRAERDGADSGRTYSIVCDVTDHAGNTATASCVVVVPHDRRKAK